MKEKEKIIGSICMVMMSIIFVLGGYFISKSNRLIECDEIFSEETTHNKDKTTEKDVFNEIENEDTTENATEKKYIVVDIKGPVKNPREYVLLEGSRIRDIINEAGGLTKEANENLIHFSKKLNDEDCIVIPKIGEELEENDEVKDLVETEKGVKNTGKENNKININKASIEQLKTLSGIGDSKAKAILDYRESNGGFKSIDELSNIDGIGGKTLEKLRDKVDIR
ncbi:helix-hairpin-helix domain-containing protein [Clostridium senegalense]|uniref:Competence protein n=1 Tax=Clostridium senegalense TaxID=1465809 RepID=A0A6M0GZT8_9CLOT|nr:helix-hairpin-helix domain-containing protein [Clostridium senegalense]NEU03394.1 competence protein [Clostridium senegalense]